MKNLSVVLIALLAFSECAKKENTVPGVNTKAKSVPSNTTVSDTLRYLALGDSYTIGESVTSPESFPYQLTDSLNNRAFQVQYPAEIAKPGWTSNDLITAITVSGINNLKFSFVTLLIGVNDEAQGLSLSNYKSNFQQLLSTAINFANGDASHVFVLSIPDWGVTPFAKGQDSTISPQIASFNVINRSASMSAGVNYLDITGISKQAATNLSLIAPDGLHPSGEMYQLWVQQLAPMVATQFKN